MPRIMHLQHLISHFHPQLQSCASQKTWYLERSLLRISTSVCPPYSFVCWCNIGVHTKAVHSAPSPILASLDRLLLMQFFTLAFLAATVWANKVSIDSVNSQVCEGMYSRHDWGGSFSPHIDITVSQYGLSKYDPDSKFQLEGYDLHYVIFEYKDFKHLGKVSNDIRYYVCSDKAIELGLCDNSQRGNFLTDGDVSNTTVATGLADRLGKVPLTYHVERTGYYCVATFTGTGDTLVGNVNFQNAFGNLSASEIPKLPAYGILTVCYAVMLALFGFQFFKKRKQNQILPLQRYLLAMLGFLTFDTLVVWSYYDLVNRASSVTWFIKIYVVFLSSMNAAKMTLSFFLLLCIALGYGVVVVKLPKKVMTKCKLLAAAHFIASMIYLVGSYYSSFNGSVTSASELLTNNSSSSLWSIVFFVPVAITLTAYYVMILTSIKATTANLHKQRQVIKLQLYENLFRIIAFSVILTVGGMALSVFILLSLSATETLEQLWKGSYFLYDFWPSVVFFGIFIGISWLWRPTEASYMLAVSQQVSSFEGDEEQAGNAGYQHHHEFELDDLSLMSHSDEENGHRDSFELLNQNIPTEQPPTYKESETVELGAETGTASNTFFELGDDDLDQDEREDGEGSTSKKTE